MCETIGYYERSHDVITQECRDVPQEKCQEVQERQCDLFVKVEFQSCIYTEYFLTNPTFLGHFFRYFFVKLILIRTEAVAVVSHVKEFAFLAQTSLKILFQALVLSSQSASTTSSRNSGPEVKLLERVDK